MADKPVIDLILMNAGQLITVAGSSESPRRGEDMARTGLIEDGAVAVKDGVIVAVGVTAEVLEQVDISPGATVLDTANKVVLPGLVDPHTHLVFYGRFGAHGIRRAAGSFVKCGYQPEKH